jgi:hypothetical protein
MSVQYKRTVHVHISHGYVNIQATHHNGTGLNKTRLCFCNRIQNSICPMATVSFSCYHLICELLVHLHRALWTYECVPAKLHQYVMVLLHGTHHSHCVMLQHLYICCTCCILSACAKADSDPNCRWWHHNSEPLNWQGQCIAGSFVGPAPLFMRLNWWKQPNSNRSKYGHNMIHTIVRLHASQLVKIWGSFTC